MSNSDLVEIDRRLAQIDRRLAQIDRRLAQIDRRSRIILTQVLRPLLSDTTMSKKEQVELLHGLGVDNKEISQTMGISEGSVRGHLSVLRSHAADKATGE